MEIKNLFARFKLLNFKKSSNNPRRTQMKKSTPTANGFTKLVSGILVIAAIVLFGNITNAKAATYSANTAQTELTHSAKSLNGMTLASIPGHIESKSGAAKCGAGKCGDSEKSKTVKKDAKKVESKCGAGKCGEGKCGDTAKSAKVKKDAKSKVKDAKKAAAKCGAGKCGDMEKTSKVKTNVKSKVKNAKKTVAKDAKKVEGKCGAGKCGSK